MHSSYDPQPFFHLAFCFPHSTPSSGVGHFSFAGGFTRGVRLPVRPPAHATAISFKVSVTLKEYSTAR